MKNKQFRLSAKKLYLTYSQINKNVTHEDILNFLSKKLSIGEHLIVLENHQDGGLHAHVLLVLKKRCNFITPNCLDLEYEKETFHGNYQTAKQINSLIRYLIKEDTNYLTNMKFNFEIYEDRIIEPEEYALHQSKKIGIAQALVDYKNKYPERAIRNINSLEKNIQKTLELDNKVKKLKNDITLEDFDFTKIERGCEFKDWLDSEIKRSLIISGKSGTGKSLLAKTIMKFLKIPHLRATHYEGLKHLEDDHKGFLLDDAKLNHLDEPSLINLFDTQDRNDLRLLHQTKSKKEHLVQIFTINEVKDLIKKLIPAISRRILVLDVQKPIINIENATVNNNYYLNNIKIDKGNRDIWERLTGEKLSDNDNNNE